jgi:hypothetical protein
MVRTAQRVLLLLANLLAGPALGGELGGTVLDGQTMQPLPGATVSARTSGAEDAAELSRATTDEAGKFHLDAVPDEVFFLRIAAASHESSTERVDPADRGDRIFVLYPPGTFSEVIEVTGRGPQKPIAPGQQDLGRTEITRLPGTRGDALQSVKSLPGVANANAPGAGPGLLVIRGAAPEDSTVLLDGIEIPLLYHFFGLQSILPSEFIQTIDYLPGGFGVEEGRATGGVISIVTRDQPSDEFTGFAELSFINLGAFVQGPLSRARNLDISAAVRRSTIDFILPAVLPEDSDLAFTTAPQYYDGQLRLDWRPTGRDHVSWLGLISFDLLTLLNDSINPNEPALSGRFENETSFTRAITTWRHDGPRLDSRLVLSLGTTGLRFEIGSDRYLDVTNRRVELRGDTTWSLHEKVALRAGGDARWGESDLRFKLPLPPAEGEPVGNFSTRPLITRDDTVGESVLSAYAAVDLTPLPRTTVTSGVRLDHYDHLGATTVSPRVALRQRLGEALTARASVGSYSRPLLQDESVPDYLEPETATQVVAGADYELARGITAALSGFYTDRRRLVVRDPTLAMTAPDRSYVNRGNGRSFGSEALLRAKRDAFFGWLAYTLSRSDRTDEPGSERRLFDFDQTHNFIAVGSYRLGAWELGARWQYTTGEPDTPVTGAIYQADFNVHVPTFGKVNSNRLEAAHQLDLRVDRRWRFRTWELSAYLDVSNVYGHARTLDYRYNFDYTEREAITELPVLPAFGVRGTF